MRRIRISVRDAEDFTALRLRIDHPMESGERKDSLGHQIPPWFLTRLEVMLNQQAISTIKLGPHIAKNPAFSLALKDIKKGDEIVVKWFDNRLESGEHKRIVN